MSSAEVGWELARPSHRPTDAAAGVFIRLLVELRIKDFGGGVGRWGLQLDPGLLSATFLCMACLRAHLA